MADSRLRTLERRWQESGTEEDLLRYTHAVRATGNDVPYGLRVQETFLYTPMGANQQGLSEYRHKTTGMIFVLIPAGEFMMGPSEMSDPAVGDEEAIDPVRRVFGEPFLMAKYPWTGREWHRVTGELPSHFPTQDMVREGLGLPADHPDRADAITRMELPDSDGKLWGDHPVESVSWDRCREVEDWINRIDFARRFNASFVLRYNADDVNDDDVPVWTTWLEYEHSDDTARREDGEVAVPFLGAPLVFSKKVEAAYHAWRWNEAGEPVGFQLPTEAMWEYAARAGTTTRYPNGDTEADLEKIAWFGGEYENGHKAVGLKAPNNWGLHDNCGNVFEWTRCMWRRDIDPNPAAVNGFQANGETGNGPPVYLTDEAIAEIVVSSRYERALPGEEEEAAESDQPGGSSSDPTQRCSSSATSDSERSPSVHTAGPISQDHQTGSASTDTRVTRDVAPEELGEPGTFSPDPTAPSGETPVLRSNSETSDGATSTGSTTTTGSLTSSSPSAGESGDHQRVVQDGGTNSVSSAPGITSASDSLGEDDSSDPTRGPSGEGTGSSEPESSASPATGTTASTSTGEHDHPGAPGNPVTSAEDLTQQIMEGQSQSDFPVPGPHTSTSPGRVVEPGSSSTATPSTQTQSSSGARGILSSIRDTSTRLTSPSRSPQTSSSSRPGDSLGTGTATDSSGTTTSRTSTQTRTHQASATEQHGEGGDADFPSLRHRLSSSTSPRQVERSSSAPGEAQLTGSSPSQVSSMKECAEANPGCGSPTSGPTYTETTSPLTRPGSSPETSPTCSSEAGPAGGPGDDVPFGLGGSEEPWRHAKSSAPLSSITEASDQRGGPSTQGSRPTETSSSGDHRGQPGSPEIDASSKTEEEPPPDHSEFPGVSSAQDQQQGFVTETSVPVSFIGVGGEPPLGQSQGRSGSIESTTRCSASMESNGSLSPQDRETSRSSGATPGETPDAETDGSAAQDQGDEVGAPSGAVTPGEGGDVPFGTAQSESSERGRAGALSPSSPEGTISPLGPSTTEPDAHGERGDADFPPTRSQRYRSSSDTLQGTSTRSATERGPGESPSPQSSEEQCLEQWTSPSTRPSPEVGARSQSSTVVSPPCPEMADGSLTAGTQIGSSDSEPGGEGGDADFTHESSMNSSEVSSPSSATTSPRSQMSPSLPPQGQLNPSDGSVEPSEPSVYGPIAVEAGAGQAFSQGLDDTLRASAISLGIPRELAQPGGAGSSDFTEGFSSNRWRSKSDALSSSSQGESHQPGSKTPSTRSDSRKARGETPSTSRSSASSQCPSRSEESPSTAHATPTHTTVPQQPPRATCSDELAKAADGTALMSSGVSITAQDVAVVPDSTVFGQVGEVGEPPFSSRESSDESTLPQQDESILGRSWSESSGGLLLPSNTEDDEPVESSEGFPSPATLQDLRSEILGITTNDDRTQEQERPGGAAADADSFLAGVTAKWAPLLAGIDDRDRDIAAALIENQQRSRVFDEWPGERSEDITVGSFLKFQFPIIRQAWPSIIASDLIGVQSMVDPVTYAGRGGSRADQYVDADDLRIIIARNRGTPTGGVRAAYRVR